MHFMLYDVVQPSYQWNWKLAICNKVERPCLQIEDVLKSCECSAPEFLDVIGTKVLKVPKRENFSLAFFTLGEPTWVCDLGSGKKSRIFYQMIPDFEGLWFFAAYWVCGK
jgi:hypothetical protein